jgi:NADH:ubiquinone reductase (H+-translocating)
MINEETNRPYPPTAQIAMQQGKLIASNLVKLVRNRIDLEPFVFDNKGTICSLGHDDAVGVICGKKIKGKAASFMKKMIDNKALFMIGGPSLFDKKSRLENLTEAAFFILFRSYILWMIV